MFRRTRQFISRFRWYFIAFGSWFLVWYYFALPKQLFTDPTCTVLYDKKGDILGARIAEDGQWRFPHNENVPEKFAKALIFFEDKTFYRHIGISARGIGRALKQNFSQGKVVSGGSTLTMQIVRLMRKGRGRSISEKIIEAVLATRIELAYTKNEILAYYASNAPMGGNVVGLDAAAWRYYGRTPDELSWAESATLAVLPNAPSHIFPGKNQSRLLEKRNRVLKGLYEQHEFDTTTLITAIAEPLPSAPPDLPQMAPHLMDRLIRYGHKGKGIHTPIDYQLQDHVNRILQRHHEKLQENQIFNAACIVVDVNEGNVIAYTGNVKNEDPEHGSDVDIITAPRSSGSILKPLLYAGMLNDGLITPGMLFPDVPTHISGYSPKNYYQRYDGVVPANRALSRSLNVPAVRMLQQCGIAKFHYLLKRIGFSSLVFPSSHYGLSLVLGGAEVSLWDLAHVYASMARVLNQYPDFNSDLYKRPRLILEDTTAQPFSESIEPVLNPASIYFTMQAMVEVARPDEDANWQYYSGSSRIAWKTGTSFGFRDAWAVGVSPGYVVAVWVGNADGEGRPGLVGIEAAAPILFDVFSRLPKTGWFKKPFDDMAKVPICRLSGHRASTLCSPTDTIYIPQSSLATQACPYHQLLHLDQEGKFRVDGNCVDPSEMKNEAWFVLPPVMEYYYKSRNPSYKPIPPYRSDCIAKTDEQQMEIIYPKKPSKIYIPIGIDGEPEKTVFEATHRNKNAVIYWHLDEYFLGATSSIHQMELKPSRGMHTLTIIDEEGAKITQTFEVLSK
ncbi:MAG TPA: penicillin-binding protein 1C [Flavobacteriales bacterium]|nr:penicillin-binding protein 1C [Flavobacteriales bacterium]